MRIEENKTDGWSNLITGLGTSRDKTQYTTFDGDVEVLSDSTLKALLIGDGFAKFISHRAAEDMTKEWLTVKDDDENKILNKLTSLKARKTFTNALRWMRHFGGSIIVMGINDGRDIKEPVNTANIKSVDYIRVYDRTSVSITDINFNQDPNDVHYGEPEFYTISPRYGGTYEVHWTRCLVFKGIELPASVDISQYWYWGMSILQPIWTQIKDIAAGERNISKLLYEFVIGKYKIKGLAKMMAEGKEDDIKKMMDIIDLGKSMLQAYLLDADGDDYTRDSANVSGLSDVLDRFMQFLAGVSGYPVTLLFGRSAAGMNATGEGDMDNYYNNIKSTQTTDFIPQIQTLVNYINMSKEFKSVKISDPEVIPNSLYQLSDSEMLDNRKKQAEIDKIYVEIGSLDSMEVRESRFSNGYSYETNIEDIPDNEYIEPITQEETQSEQTDSIIINDSVVDKIKGIFRKK